MQRELASLAQRFDVLVVGGGVQGACIARLAAMNGLAVAILDKGDFGSATSRNSAKLLHCGIRYLQHFDVPRVRESMRAVRAWFRFAPHLVRPLRVVVPAYGHGTRGLVALAGAMTAFNMLSAGRNDGVRPAIHMPRSGVLTRRRLYDRFPVLAGGDVTGGAHWHDGQMLDATRLTIECLHDAVGSGAVAANHVECFALLQSRCGVEGVAARDLSTGREFEVRAGITINAAGPWVERVLQGGSARLGRRKLATWTRNVNLVTRRLFEGHETLGVSSDQASDASIGKSKRLFFASPWHGCTVVGTAHEIHVGDPDNLSATDELVDGFLAEIREAAPGFGLQPADVRSVHIGLTPSEGSATERAKRPVILDHDLAEGVPGMVSVAAIKFTTAPVVAASTVRLALAKLGRADPARTFDVSAAGAPDESMRIDADALHTGTGQPDELAWLTRVYGSRSLQCLDRALPDGIDAAERAFRCRVLFGIEQEMVMRLSDAVLRATDWAERGLLTNGQLEWCASVLGSAHGWSDDRFRQEIDRTCASMERLGIRPLDAEKWRKCEPAG